MTQRDWGLSCQKLAVGNVHGKLDFPTRHFIRCDQSYGNLKHLVFLGFYTFWTPVKEVVIVEFGFTNIEFKKICQGRGNKEFWSDKFGNVHRTRNFFQWILLHTSSTCSQDMETFVFFLSWQSFKVSNKRIDSNSRDSRPFSQLLDQ